MKLCYFNDYRLGVVVADNVVDVTEAVKDIPHLDNRDLMIGLNGSQYASSVHTIDSQGKLIGHAKYLGQLCIEMQDLAHTVASRSPNKTMEPTR